MEWRAQRGAAKDTIHFQSSLYFMLSRRHFRLVRSIRQGMIRPNNKFPILLYGKEFPRFFQFKRFNNFKDQYELYHLQNENTLQDDLQRHHFLHYLTKRRSRQRTKLIRRQKLEHLKQRRLVFTHLVTRYFRFHVLLPRHSRFTLANGGTNLVAPSLNVYYQRTTIRNFRFAQLRPYDKLENHTVKPNLYSGLHRDFLRFLRLTRDTTMFTNHDNAMPLRATRRTIPTTTRPFNTRPCILQ